MWRAPSLARKADTTWDQSRVMALARPGGAIGSVRGFAFNWASQASGVCGPASQAYVRDLGAAAVLDYTREDFTGQGVTYDVILDVLGRSSWARCRGLLSEGGRYLRASFKGRELLQMLWTSLWRGSRRVICALAPGDRAALRAVKALVEAGELRAVIDRSFGLEELAEAHRYAESGQKHGAIAVRVR